MMEIVREYLHTAHLNMSSGLLMSPFSLAWALETQYNGDKFSNNVGKNICWRVYVIFHSICSVKKMKYFTPLKRPILRVKNQNLKWHEIGMKESFFVSSVFLYCFPLHWVTLGFLFACLLVCFSSLTSIFISVSWGKTYKDLGNKKCLISNQQDTTMFLKQRNRCASTKTLTQQWVFLENTDTAEWLAVLYQLSLNIFVLYSE